MSRRTVLVGSFLKERKNRYSPEEANTLKFRRLEKIDFSGNIHLTDIRNTRTGMILIRKGDLVISGINVEKGAIAVYDGEEDVLATIHYSSYSFDKEEMDIEYFKYFLRSKTFKEIVYSNTRGGIKTELKPKRFLSLTILLPHLDKQLEIRRTLDSVKDEIEELGQLDRSNENYVARLRQAILQEAVSGKLVPQDPEDEPASVLLERIQKDKEILFGNERSGKIDLIDPEKIPYDLPKNWIWCHLENVGLLQRGKSKHRPRNDPSLFEDGKYPLVQTGDISKAKNQNGLIETYTSKYNESGLKQSKLWPKGTLCISIAANIAETGFLKFDACFPDSVVAFVPVIDQSIARYVMLFIELTKSDIEEFAPSTAQKNINLGILNSLLLPLPPLAEQKRILTKVDDLMKLCDELEEKVKENRNNSDLLMETVLKEAFAS